jgi:hypothetical protein
MTIALGVAVHPSMPHRTGLAIVLALRNESDPRRGSRPGVAGIEGSTDWP